MAAGMGMQLFPDGRSVMDGTLMCRFIGFTLILSHQRLFRCPVMARVYVVVQAMRLYLIFEVLCLFFSKESNVSIQNIFFIEEYIYIYILPYI